MALKPAAVNACLTDSADTNTLHLLATMRYGSLQSEMKTHEHAGTARLDDDAVLGAPCKEPQTR